MVENGKAVGCAETVERAKSVEGGNSIEVTKAVEGANSIEVTKAVKNDSCIKKLTCIECPRGCELTAVLSGGEVKEVSGNFCPKGKTYAISEVIMPTRVVTGTVRHISGDMISVKTNKAVDKTKIFEVIAEINVVRPIGKIKIGDVIIKNVCSSGADVVATKNNW